MDDRHLNWLDLRESHHHVQVISRSVHSIAVTLAPIFNMHGQLDKKFFLFKHVISIIMIFLNTVWIPVKLKGSTSRLYYLRKKNHTPRGWGGHRIKTPQHKQRNLVQYSP